MDIMDMIKQSLQANVNLSDGIRTNIFELVSILHSKFPDVDLNNLRNRLTTLQVKKLNKFINNNVSMYSNVENILYLNQEKLSGEYDAKHVLMYELLNIASSTENRRGFIQDGRFEALNIGYTEIMANFLVGNDSDKALYPEQAIETNLISIIVGNDILKKAYFTNDTELLIKGFNDAGVQI